jgi:hypothetical protein
LNFEFRILNWCSLRVLSRLNNLPSVVAPSHLKSILYENIQEHKLIRALGYTAIASTIYNAIQERICALEYHEPKAAHLRIRGPKSVDTLTITFSPIHRLSVVPAREYPDPFSPAILARMNPETTPPPALLRRMAALAAASAQPNLAMLVPTSFEAASELCQNAARSTVTHKSKFPRVRGVIANP